ncbi:hypothetical protein [Halosegnis sp.]|uniref:hypothetical protein n=1 Tax=Halosegnis sp. TaxID=2864959 RepID=UPI0035D3E060
MSTADSPSTSATALPGPARRLGQVVRGVAFWSGILLAFAQVPLLAAGVTAKRPMLLVALLTVNVAAMAVGSGYRA